MNPSSAECNINAFSSAALPLPWAVDIKTSRVLSPSPKPGGGRRRRSFAQNQQTPYFSENCGYFCNGKSSPPSTPLALGHVTSTPPSRSPFLSLVGAVSLNVRSTRSRVLHFLSSWRRRDCVKRPPGSCAILPARRSFYPLLLLLLPRFLASRSRHSTCSGDRRLTRVFVASAVAVRAPSRRRRSSPALDPDSSRQGSHAAIFPRGAVASSQCESRRPVSNARGSLRGVVFVGL